MLPSDTKWYLYVRPKHNRHSNDTQFIYCITSNQFALHSWFMMHAMIMVHYTQLINSDEWGHPGISQKCSVRSVPSWFPEFCNSQCLSHVAATFIVGQTKASIAERFQTGQIQGTAINSYPSNKSNTSNTLPRQWIKSMAHMTWWQGYAAMRTTPPLKWERGHQDPKHTSHVHIVYISRITMWMILPQVHLRKPCYDFSFL